MITPYRFDLYQRSGDPGIPNGLSTGVANFINGRQDLVQLSAYGATGGITVSGKEPHESNSINIKPRYLKGQGTPIIFTSLMVANGYILFDHRPDQGQIVVSRAHFPSQSGLNLRDYFAFLTCTAVLGWNIDDLRRHHEIFHCPFDSLPTESNIVSMMMRGRLCDKCEGLIEDNIDKGYVEQSLVLSISKVLKDIALQTKNGRPYRETKTIKSQADITKSSKPSTPVQEEASIEADAEVVKPAPAETGIETNDPKGKIQPDFVSGGAFPAKSDDIDVIDALGYEDYANALSRVISHKDTETPLTISICAPWGRGKSVLMKFIEKRLKKDCTTINVNAWEFAKTSNIWAELYARIISQIEQKLGPWKKIRFRFKFWKKSSPKIFWSFVGLVLVLKCLIILWIADLFVDVQIASLPTVISWPLSQIEENGVLGLIIIILTSSLPWLWNNFGNLSNRILKNMNDGLSKRTPGTEQEVLENIEIVQSVLQEVSKKRIVIFVDDIDRISPNQILEVLEAVKLFLHVKGFVFVIAMDAKVVSLAVGEHYEFVAEQFKNPEQWGRDYLEKIIQIPFHLPRLNEEQRLQLCDDILAEYSSEDEATLKGESGDEEYNEQTIASNASEPPLHEDEIKEEAPDVDHETPIDKKLDDTDRNRILAGDGKSFLDNSPQLTTQEKECIRSILRAENFDISPRLLKRFINIYLVSRYLYFFTLEREGKKTSVPPHDLIKWLALSVAYPFEVRALTKWLQNNNWERPVGPDNKPFDNNGTFSLKTGTLFDNLDDARLTQVGRFITTQNINMSIVWQTLDITSCFNLVLD